MNPINDQIVKSALLNFIGIVPNVVKHCLKNRNGWICRVFSLLTVPSPSLEQAIPVNIYTSSHLFYLQHLLLNSAFFFFLLFFFFLFNLFFFFFTGSGEVAPLWYKSSTPVSTLLSGCWHHQEYWARVLIIFFYWEALIHFLVKMQTVDTGFVYIGICLFHSLLPHRPFIYSPWSPRVLQDTCWTKQKRHLGQIFFLKNLEFLFLSEISFCV